MGSRGRGLAAAAASAALVAVLASGCGGGEGVATAAEEYSRRPVDVRPAKLPPLPVKRLPSGDKVIPIDSDVYFAFDSARLTGIARARLRTELLARVRAFLAKTGSRVALRGYTDGVGDRSYNLRLSRARARSVRRFLVAGGAPPRRMTAAGLGESEAISSRPDHRLRRVDVVLREGGSR
jgi:outer membrane protein OmpA-like peptidoglycan-associated protein